MSLTLRPAQLRDLGYVLSLAQNGARHGHFDARIATEKHFFRDYLTRAITRGEDARGYITEVSVMDVSGQAIGATVVTQAIGTPDIGVELAMIALKPGSRGYGYGRMTLDALLDRYLSIGSVYARCLPASQQLRQMLLRRDFSEVGMSERAVILRHPVVNLLGALQGA